MAENWNMFNYVCGECSKSALNSYKFIKKCQKNNEQLSLAVENLSNGFEHTADDIEDFSSMYLSINVAEDKIEQFFDNSRRLHSEQSALARFKFISNAKETNSVSKKSARQKDYSTIFIKTHELVLDPSKQEYRCKMCMKLYPTSGSLRQHFFSVHFKKEFKCPDCSKCFGTSGLLHTHKMQSHSFVTCNDCGKKLLNRQSTLKRHALTHDTKVAKVCHRCGRKYKKTTDYERHMQQDSCTVPSKAMGNYVCDYCGKETHFRHQLLSHIRFEHLGARGYICKWCKRKCYNESALKIHVLKHTKEKNFICSMCGGKFVTRQSLINHTRLHTGERPYPCKQCDQSFLSASRRTDHIDRYHKQMIFECDQCHTKLNARRSLIKHKKHHCLVPMEA